jgi:hypothetical protein
MGKDRVHAFDVIVDAVGDSGRLLPKIRLEQCAEFGPVTIRVRSKRDDEWIRVPPVDAISPVEAQGLANSLVNDGWEAVVVVDGEERDYAWEMERTRKNPIRVDWSGATVLGEGVRL